jgi:PST family polysaccharide transporter
VFLNYLIVSRLTGFRWSIENEQTGLLFLGLIVVVFCGFYVLPTLWAGCVGTLAAVLSAVYSVRLLLDLIPVDQIPIAMQRVLLWCRPAASVSLR